MKQKCFIVLNILIVGCSIGLTQKIESGNKMDDIQQLTDEFVKPPMSSRPGAYWCWLTGDMNVIDGKKYCQTNIPFITKDRVLGGDEIFHIQHAGLLGPVFLESIRYSLGN